MSVSSTRPSPEKAVNVSVKFTLCLQHLIQHLRVSGGSLNVDDTNRYHSLSEKLIGIMPAVFTFIIYGPRSLGP